MMKARKYRRKRISHKLLEQAQMRLLDLSAEQVERLERHRSYLELYWNSPVLPAEALVDVVGHKHGSAFCAGLNGELCSSWRV
jgi:hypothetical protein